MGLAFLLLGLLPLAILPDYFSKDEADEDADIVPEEENDEDLVDLLTSPIEGLEILAPVIDEVDVPGDGAPVVGEILSPSDEDDMASDEPVVGEVLSPVDSIDSLAPDLELNFEEVVGTGFASISDFAVGSDILHITMSPDSVEGTLDIEVLPTADGSDAQVYVEGQLIAVLSGAAGASASDIVVNVARLS